MHESCFGQNPDLVPDPVFFNHYTPNLPTTDPNYILPGNFLFTINGKKIPEPMTLALLLLGLTALTTLRRPR